MILSKDDLIPFTFFFQVHGSQNFKPAKVTMMNLQLFSPAHTLGAFCSLVPTLVGIAAMAKPYCCKEAQAASLHERGPAALSDKKLLLKRKESNTI